MSLSLKRRKREMAQAQEAQEGKPVVAKAGARAHFEPKTENQSTYVDAVRDNTITFCIGPAGCGKTYIATSLGAQALMNGNYERLVITRPAIEAGERIGFIPGGIDEKLHPYMMPVIDNLNRCFGPAKVKVFKEKSIIEIAPVAFLRGRSLEHCFIVADEAQNLTIAQMRMLLTRLGAGSKLVVNGDVTQSDLPRNVPSGLLHAKDILQGIPGIAWVELGNHDIVRHPLVQAIVEAYEKATAVVQ
jgi:phosphate starvation-inducible PhoH-like protein